MESKKERKWIDEPWFDRGVTADDVNLTNQLAPDQIDDELNKRIGHAYEGGYAKFEYEDAREFIRKCAEDGVGFAVSY